MRPPRGIAVTAITRLCPTLTGASTAPQRTVDLVQSRPTSMVPMASAIATSHAAASRLGEGRTVVATRQAGSAGWHRVRRAGRRRARSVPPAQPCRPPQRDGGARPDRPSPQSRSRSRSGAASRPSPPSPRPVGRTPSERTPPRTWSCDPGQRPAGRDDEDRQRRDGHGPSQRDEQHREHRHAHHDVPDVEVATVLRDPATPAGLTAPSSRRRRRPGRRPEGWPPAEHPRARWRGQRLPQPLLRLSPSGRPSRSA